jgi:hypothetical protein
VIYFFPLSNTTTCMFVSQYSYLSIILAIFMKSIELKTNCPDAKTAVDECPKVCFDAPNCDAALGKQIEDIFQHKLDAGVYIFLLAIAATILVNSSSQISTLTVSVNLCQYSAMKDNTNCPQVKDCAKFCLDAASGGGDQSMRQKIDDIVKPKIKQGETL